MLDNRVVDNDEGGISIESTDHVVLRRNVLTGNRVSQLLSTQSMVQSDDNCFGPRPGQFVVDLTPYPPGAQFRTLANYRARHRQELGSREGDCGPPATLPDVGQLHAESMGYADLARRLLSGEPVPTEGLFRRWRDWLLGPLGRR